MKREKTIFPVKFTLILCILAALYAVSVILYLYVEEGRPLGGRDFHQFWYAGHFVLQGTDPYAAYFAKELPRLPIKYLDGVTVTQYPVAQGKLAIIPSNTPVILLLLSPFSLFSWGVAKWLFLIVN